MKLQVVLFVCTLLSVSVKSARILGVLHVPTRSHYNIGSSILFALAAKGHDVTIASPYPTKGKIPNVRDVFLDKVIPIGDDSRKTWMNMSNANALSTFVEFSNFSNSLADAALRSADMEKLLKSGEKFDVVIIEPFGNYAHFGLANHFNAHLVLLTTGDTLFVSTLAGNPSPWSFVPSGVTSHTDRMTFFERLANGLAYLSLEFYNYVLVFPTQKKLYEEFFKNGPDFEEVIYNASLYLVNSNVVFETPRPYLPNMIKIGGVHIKEAKKLPQDIQNYMDNAKEEGVILFSLGSNLHSNELPAEKRDAIVKTLAKFPQKVLWKFEDENLPGKPDNVKIGKWLPQTDILAHPNIKLFISHGGLLSSTEALHRGVPILGIPFYGDQHTNTGKFVQAGYGEKLAYEDLTEETFTAKLKQVLGNSSYMKNIKRDSEILKDQLNKPLDQAVFWIEYIIRHNGAKYLRATSNELLLVQYLFLDIIVFIVFVSSVSIFVIYAAIKKLCCSRKTKNTNERKKPKRE